MKELTILAFFDIVLEVAISENDSLKRAVSRQLILEDIKININAEINNKSGTFRLRWKDLLVEFKQGSSNKYEYEFIISDDLSNFKKIKV